MGIYVYEPWPDSVDNGGLCGPLLCSTCKCHIEKNAAFELTLEHPIDPGGKWRNLVYGNLISADVPLPPVPEFSPTVPFQFVTTIYAATVQNVSYAARGVTQFADNGGIRYAVLPVGASVYVVDAIDEWRKVRWSRGCGWIAASSLNIAGTPTTIPNTVYGMESKVPAAKSRPQLFRIHSTTHTASKVTVRALHVFYDSLGDYVSYAATTASCDTVLNGLYNARQLPVGNVRVHTNIVADAAVAAWERSGFVEALMSPSNGLLSYWDAALIRDNWDVSIVGGYGKDRGYIIADGCNLLGIEYSVDTSDVVTHLYPLGQTTKGKPLAIPANTYDVDGESIQCGPLVNSPNHLDDYANYRMFVLDLGSQVKATGTTSSALNAAYIKLIRAALAKFSNEQVDLPSVTLKVDFLMLGDTAEYAQYKALDKLFLYDLVRVRDSRLGIDVTTEVNRIEWDCILGRYNSIELGSIRQNYARTRLASWQIPGYASLQSYVDTISGLV